MTVNNKSEGFTLLEVLVALAVFAMLALATQRFFSATLTGHDYILEQERSLSQLQRAVTIMDGDFFQFSQRRMRLDGDEPLEQLFIAERYLFDSQDIGFAFVRDGWTNPGMLLPRSELQPVAYRLFENKLQRLYFNFVDMASGSEPRVQSLLSGVTEMKLEYYSKKRWLEELPEETLPKLVRVTLVTELFGDITRVFPLINQTIQPKQQSPAQDP